MSDSELDFDQLHGIIETLTTEMQQRFGDREPTEKELQEFLAERLRAEGRSEEEIQQIMREIAE